MEKVKSAERQRMSQIFSLPTAQTETDDATHPPGSPGSPDNNAPDAPPQSTHLSAFASDAVSPVQVLSQPQHQFLTRFFNGRVP